MMVDKLWFLIPEMILFAGVVAVSIMGLSPVKKLRDHVPLVTAAFLLAAAIVNPFLYSDDRIARAALLMPTLGLYIKTLVALLGVLLVMLSVGLIDRRIERLMQQGKARFDPLRVNRGEFFVFFLLSITGAMLVCQANDLIWLFLAVELVSLPTYVMVALSRPSPKAMEAAVKYFFLGAMATGVFLYGFALLYGSTGTLILTDMRDVFAQQAAGGGVNLIGITGMILSILGLSFKIAAAPMHFYVADVYEGAASAVTAFLGFVPKAAGMVAIVLLLGTMGWTGHGEAFGLPLPVNITLVTICALTMLLGNVGALLQTNVKRMLAYSSIAHSGYMLIGVIAGPGLGLASVMFYLAVYGVTNTAAFAVLAGLERRGLEIETLDEIAGLRQKHPRMALAMALSSGSLLGIPPLLGFWAKLLLFMAGIGAGHIGLVVFAGVNTAISAWYYLALVRWPLLLTPTGLSETVERGPAAWPRVAAVLGAIAVVVLPIFTAGLYRATEIAVREMPANDMPRAVSREAE